MNLENRYEVMALVEAKMCNPNGDPDMGNLPRMDFATSRGIITDVAFKARMRHYVQEAYGLQDGMDILMLNGANLNKAIAQASIAANGNTIAPGKNSQDAAQLMCQRFWDVRTFGGVLSTGLNAGQVRGAVQVSMALSVDEIEPMSVSVTRCCYTEDIKTKEGKKGKKGDASPAVNLNNMTPDVMMDLFDKLDASKEDSEKRTIGTKTYIPYGLYVLKMTVSANLAEKVGFTEDDFRILLESVMQMYEVGFSSSKMGMSVISPVLVFKHVGTNPQNPAQAVRECKLGCAPAYQLFDLLEIEKKDGVDAPRSCADYDLRLRLDKLPVGVICGVKRAAYADVEWLTSTQAENLLLL